MLWCPEATSVGPPVFCWDGLVMVTPHEIPTSNRVVAIKVSSDDIILGASWPAVGVEIVGRDVSSWIGCEATRPRAMTKLRVLSSERLRSLEAFIDFVRGARRGHERG